MMPSFVVQHGLHEGPQQQAVVRRDEMQRPAHHRESHQRPVVDQIRYRHRVEAGEPRPQADVRVVRDLRLQTHEVVHGVARGDGRAFQQQLPSERCPVQRAHREHLRGHGVTATAVQPASGRGSASRVSRSTPALLLTTTTRRPSAASRTWSIVVDPRSVRSLPAQPAANATCAKSSVLATTHPCSPDGLTDRASHGLRDLTLVAGLSLQPVEGSDLPEEPAREDDRNHHAGPRAEMPLAAERLQACAGRNGEHRERGQQEPRREAGDEEQVLHREGDPHDGRHAHPERSPAIRAGPKRPRAETDQHHPPQDAHPGERATRLRTEQRAVGEPEVFGDAGERAAHVGHRARGLDRFAGPAVSNAHLDQPGERAHRHPHDHGHDRPHRSAHRQDHDRRPPPRGPRHPVVA